MKNNKTLFVFAFTCFLGIKIFAQNMNTSAGGDAIGTGGSAAYSIGQVMYTTYVGTNGSVAQGVEQAYEVSLVMSVEQTDNLNSNIQVFPNPSSDYLVLSLNDQELSTLSFQLIELSGKVIETRKITNSKETIDLELLSKATYLLKINNKDKEIKTYKIIKH